MKIKFLLALVLSGLAFNAVAAGDNVRLSGVLVDSPCTLPDDDLDIHLDFGTIIEKYLYQYQRTKSQPFSIHLMGCDPAILSSVSVTFEGTTDTELTTMLALDATSTAKGVAIGLELADGTPLALNKASPFTQLTTGNNTLAFNAFVQATPTVIANKSLTAGSFTAISTFLIAYQ